METRRKLGVTGEIALLGGAEEHLTLRGIELLERIDECGSITGAAKKTGISYKTAWELADALGGLSDRPLLVREAGGRGGGGTRLTAEGKEIVGRFRSIQREHRAFLANLSEKAGDLEKFRRFTRRLYMKVSARNLFAGVVKTIRKGAVNTEVVLSLPGGDEVVAVVTNESVKTLGLKKGGETYAVVKASSVILGKDVHSAAISARNVLCGAVKGVKTGVVNSDVTLVLAGGDLLSAVITKESAKRLAFRPGEHACAVFKASSVILGVG